MKYRSTRGYISNVSFEDTLLTGWLPDGSLLMPETIPRMHKEELQTWADLSYKEICMKMFNIFAGEDFLLPEELKDLLDVAFKKFPADIAPLTKVFDQSYILELFHGPTHAFKDLSLAVIGPLLDRVIKKKNKPCLVYVATSGDTGSAVIEVTRDLPNIDTLVFFPGGEEITALQRLQMTTVPSKNIHAFSGDCFCDEFDKFLSSSIQPIKDKYPEVLVTSLNSLTWLRVMQQMVHIIYAYFRAAKNFENVNFFIPTGGMGHMTSAVLVQQLGVPISFSPCFNEKNLNGCNFLLGKDFELNKKVNKSLSVAMDIQQPPNLERLIYLWTNGDVEKVRLYMDEINNGKSRLSDQLLNTIQTSITPFVASDDDIISTIQSFKEDTGTLIDPHTATGLTAHYKRHSRKDGPNIYCGCASPMKFTEVLTLANIPIPEEYVNYLATLKSKKEFHKVLPKNVEEWEDYIIKYIDENIVNKTV